MADLPRLNGIIKALEEGGWRRLLTAIEREDLIGGARYDTGPGTRRIMNAVRLVPGRLGR